MLCISAQRRAFLGKKRTAVDVVLIRQAIEGGRYRTQRAGRAAKLKKNSITRCGNSTSSTMDVDVSKMTDECPFCIKIPFKDENSHYYYFYFCTKTIERWKHKDKTKTTINMMDESERVRRTHRKGSYHLVASKNKLPTDEYEQEEDYLFQYLLSQQVPHPKKNSANIKAAKQTFLQELALSVRISPVP